MNCNDVMARLKPAARRRLQAKAQEQGLALESLVGQNLELGLISPQDLVFVGGGIASIWPADREALTGASIVSIWPADRDGLLSRGIVSIWPADRENAKTAI